MRSGGGMADTRLEPLVLTGDERRMLENWVRRRRTAQGLALRARIVLACAQGGSNVAVAARLGVSRTTVRKWRGPFLADPLEGLPDEPRPGGPRTNTHPPAGGGVVAPPERGPPSPPPHSEPHHATPAARSPTH